MPGVWDLEVGQDSGAGRWSEVEAVPGYSEGVCHRFGKEIEEPPQLMWGEHLCCGVPREERKVRGGQATGLGNMQPSQGMCAQFYYNLKKTTTIQ